MGDLSFALSARSKDLPQIASNSSCDQHFVLVFVFVLAQMKNMQGILVGVPASFYRNLGRCLWTVFLTVIGFGAGRHAGVTWGRIIGEKRRQGGGVPSARTVREAQTLGQDRGFSSPPRQPDHPGNRQLPSAIDPGGREPFISEHRCSAIALAVVEKRLPAEQLPPQGLVSGLFSLATHVTLSYQARFTRLRGYKDSEMGTVFAWCEILSCATVFAVTREYTCRV